jgi:hypothetical protein
MDETVSGTERNTCATCYATSDNSSPVEYLILNLYVNERIKSDISKNVYFIPTPKSSLTFTRLHVVIPDRAEISRENVHNVTI